MERRPGKLAIEKRILNSRWKETGLQEIKASYGLVERNFNLVKRYIGWEVVFLFYAVVNTLTIGFIGVDRGGGGGERVLYLVAGALLWGFLSILFHEVSESVAWERWEGTIEYTFMAPIRRLTYLGGVCLWATIYGAIRTIIVMIVVASFFDLDLSRSNLAGAFVVLLVSSVSFIGLGLVAAVLPLLSPERGAQATHIMEGVILLVSGVYYDVTVMPRWIQPLAVLSPATYTLRAARAALLHGAPTRALVPELLILLAIGAVCVPLGLIVFNWGETYAMRVGRLKRSG
ncbi:MAG TPA: ABC transporter permease [Firmicutes bacterium]|nr:ABC transporter permease [Bacillota bacterium]